MSVFSQPETCINNLVNKHFPQNHGGLKKQQCNSCFCAIIGILRLFSNCAFQMGCISWLVRAASCMRRSVTWPRRAGAGLWCSVSMRITCMGSALWAIAGPASRATTQICPEGDGTWSNKVIFGSPEAATSDDYKVSYSVQRHRPDTTHWTNYLTKMIHLTVLTLSQCWPSHRMSPLTVLITSQYWSFQITISQYWLSHWTNPSDIKGATEGSSTVIKTNKWPLYLTYLLWSSWIIWVINVSNYCCIHIYILQKIVR